MKRVNQARSLKTALFCFLFLPLSGWAVVGEGVKSPYTDTIETLMRSHFPPDAEIEKHAPLWIKAWKTPDNDLYMGVEQAMLVPAPMAAVAAVLDDIDHYADLFPGYKSVKVVERSGAQLLTEWEQVVPLFFIPNITYQMIYRVETARPHQRTYRYQLRKASTLTQSDGIILIEAITALGPDRPAMTRFRELDFFDANWGPASFMGKDRLWADTVEGIYLSDVAIRLKAMHPDWTPQAAREEAKKQLRAMDKNPVHAAVNARAPLAERK